MYCRALSTTVCVFLLLPVLLSACPLCKDNLGNNPDGFAQGIFWSIFFMLGIFSAVVGFVVFIMIRGGRQADQHKAAHRETVVTE